MISNKEKRLSQAPPEALRMADGHVVNNKIHMMPNGLMINNNSSSNNHHLNHHPHQPHLVKDPHIKNLLNENNRNSHSLNHDFSQLYISNLKNQIDSHTNVKRIDPNHHPHSFEEMSSYKKEALECKKQMFQMEKSISFWSECTEYWRNKWRKTRDEKNKLRDELKLLKNRVNKLEHQLQISDEKRLRLGNEVNLLNEELSRYMFRFEDDFNNNNHNNNNNFGAKSKLKQLMPPQNIHFNSDRRVDYRKKHRRKKELFKEHQKSIPNHVSSSSDTDSKDNVQPHSYSMQKDSTNSFGKLAFYDGQSPSTSQQNINPNVMFRHHERLFDRKIMNKKRFSQVVMLDEEEIFQFNKEIPLTKNDDNSLKINSDNNDTLHTYTPNKHRHMDYVPEDVEEEDSFDGRIKPGQFLSDDLDFELKSKINNDNNDNNLDLSTMATNSECPNNGSISQNANDGSDENRSESTTTSANSNKDQTDHQKHQQQQQQRTAEKHETDDDEV